MLTPAAERWPRCEVVRRVGELAVRSVVTPRWLFARTDGNRAELTEEAARRRLSPRWPVCSQSLSPLTGPGEGITRRRLEWCAVRGDQAGLCSPNRSDWEFRQCLYIRAPLLSSILPLSRRQVSSSPCCFSCQMRRLSRGVICTLRWVQFSCRVGWDDSGGIHVISWNGLLMIHSDKKTHNICTRQHFCACFITSIWLWIEFKGEQSFTDYYNVTRWWNYFTSAFSWSARITQ